jgi:ubiquinone/menaquinone biosynthesis C-methylase UbiE
MAKWSDIQEDFKRSDSRRKRKDNLEKYLEEIDSVREIYTEEFRIKGSVLDVGGHQGKLRHFLSSSDIPLYVSADPYVESFAAIDSCPDLLKAYPNLSQPCNFIACYGENLPLKSKTFDWVHIQSVLDHVHDAYRVMVEAYRVLKDDGMVLIGLAISGGRSTLEADRSEKPTYVSPFVPKVLRLFKSLGMIKAAKYQLKVFSSKPLDDGHMCRWEYENLVDLLKSTNFTITKEHWQKPPYTACVYIAARKRTLHL